MSFWIVAKEAWYVDRLMNLQNRRIGIVVGEASGDQLGAPLVECLKKRYPNIEIVGIAGPKMMAAGCQSLYDMERLAVMGFDWQVISRVWELYKLRRFLIKTFLRNGLDLFIGIDAPAFNIGLEEQLKSGGIKTIHYISPSVWAWRSKRIFKIKRAVDLMLVMLPFESKIYQQHDIAVRYIGHPLADKFPLETNIKSARESLQLSSTKKIIALLPGSRRSEIRLMAPDILSAAQQLHKKIENVQFVVPMVDEERAELFNSLLSKEQTQLDLKVLIGKSHESIAAADFVILSSGTATLEALLLKKPMVVVYRFSRLSYWIAKRLVKLPYYSLPNLLAGRRLVDELIQDNLQAETLAEKAYSLWCDERRQVEMTKLYTDIHLKLRQSSTKKFEESVIQMLEEVH